MRADTTPTGIERIKEAVHQSDRLAGIVSEKQAVVDQKRAELVEAENDLAKARGAHATAERVLAELVASGGCTPENGCSPDHPIHMPEPKPNGVAPKPNGVSAAATPRPKPQYALDDKSVPVLWRIGFMLLADPVLDYFGTAEVIWGPGLSKAIAKNRVNANIAQLRNLGVVTALGNNTFKVNREMLAKKSKRPVEASP